ncbi:MAG: hypothetical protein HYX92_21715 [Chloroflexi bacterium]|nr:hypothetical protein [Chloroflexota bacterium]
MANRLKKALEEKQVLLGMQAFSGSPSFVEVMGLAGFDWVSIDMEHSPATFETVLQMTRTADAAGIIPLVRVAQNDPREILHALDAGGAGIIVPHVNSAEELRRALAACRYPPDGVRGTCMMVRGARYGFEEWGAFYRKLNEDVVVVPLIEEREGVEDFDAMLEVEGVDVYWLAVADLGQSYGFPGATFEHPGMRAIATDLVAKAKRAGKAMMIPVSPRLDREYCEYLVGLGFRLLSFGSDMSVFAKACKQAASYARDIRESLLKQQPTGR